MRMRHTLLVFFFFLLLLLFLFLQLGSRNTSAMESGLEHFDASGVDVFVCFKEMVCESECERLRRGELRPLRAFGHDVHVVFHGIRGDDHAIIAVCK
mmetsp:Transcript_7772/g.16642  ORF Transcript_7772/g.16642 Transcript_7772/m.16642 type:complete len:97 (+) Transcript_7772:823-1113(+)